MITRLVDSVVTAQKYKERRCAPYWEGEVMGHNRKFWIAFVLVGWFMLAFVGVIIPEGNPLAFIWILAIQQCLFLGGGLKASSRDIFQMPSAKGLLTGLFLGLGLYILNFVLSVLAIEVFTFVVGTDITLELVIRENAGLASFLSSQSPLLTLGIIFMLVIGAPLTEEVFFRGALQGFLAEVLSPRAAVMLTAMLFATLHFYIVNFVPVLLAGIYLGVILIRTKKIYYGIIAHATANFLALLNLFSSL